MNAGDILSTKFTRSTGRMEARTALSSALFQPQSITAQGMTNGTTGDHDNSHGNSHDSAPARDLRSIVERRFMRMNEAHDRIRTEVLAAHPPQGQMAR